MRPQPRTSLAALCACALFAALAIAYARLPHYGESRGPYEQRRAIEALRASHATNLDAFVNFDLRGFDTLGEEFIFMVAIAGFSLILREGRGATARGPRPPALGRRPRDREPELVLATYVYVPIALAYGLYIVVHGQLTPGGGFQGGVTLATGLLAIALGLGFETFARFAPKDAVEALEAVGTVSYVAVGCAALVASGVFLRNAFPHGETNALLSSGTILALNDGVGIAIFGGFVVLFGEFARELEREE